MRKRLFSPAAFRLHNRLAVRALSLGIMMAFSTGFGYHAVAGETGREAQSGLRAVALNQQQPAEVRGKVVDESGEALPGVSILVKGSSTGTITDFDGNYKLTVPSNATTLVFSFVGMDTQEVALAGKSAINVTLRSSSIGLDEVVAVGYGVQKKVNLTGAVAAVSAEKLENRPATTMLKSLQGQVAGVTIIDRPGETSINIRGRGNLGASSPLYIVDNVEVSSDYFNNIDPSTVESMTFLKDAASSAIYGAKGAYGVVLVTTKSGKEGKVKFTYNGSTGFQTPTVLPKTVGSYQYATLFRQAEANGGIAVANSRYSDAAIQAYRDGSNPDVFPNTNWFDLLVNDRAKFNRHSLNVTAGGKSVNTMFGIGYQDFETFSPGESNQRLNLTNKTTMELKEWLSVTSNASFIQKRYDRDRGSASWLEALRVPPTQVAKHSNGEWGSVRDGRQTTGEEARLNPYRTLMEGGRANSTTSHLLSTLSADMKFWQNKIKVTNQFGYRYYDYKSFSFSNTMPEIASWLKPGSVVSGSGISKNQMNLNRTYSEKLIYDGWVTYNDVIGGNHNIGAMVGMHADNFRSDALTVGRTNFGSNDMGSIDGGSTAPEDQLTTTQAIAEESMASYFGRLSYDYKGIYLFEANMRADASSRFAKSGRWGYFPSFSAGWRASEEEFIKQFSWINNLKLRASWGKSGNINNVGNYDIYTTFSESGTNVIDGNVVPILSEKVIGNPNLTWETTSTTDFGLDMTILKGKLDFTVDYYNRLTSDILVQANDIPVETGMPSVPARNVGSVRNSGIELVVNHSNRIRDFQYSIGGNLTINKNEIVELGSVDNLPPSSYWILKVGESIGSFYMYEADGIYSTQDIADGKAIPLGSQVPQAGMIKYVDQNDDKKIDANDRTVVGCDVPSLTYGVNIDLKYKNFGLSILGQGITNTKVYLDNETSLIFFNNSVPREWQLDNWTTENQGAVYPRLFLPSDARYTYMQKQSSFWAFDASYFRIKNITLSYNVPNRLLNRFGISDFKVFASGDNVFTFRGDKRMKDFEVERSSGRGAQLGIVTYTGGVSFSF